MKGYDVLHVNSAVKAHKKFNLDRTHLTTMDFGQIVPLFLEETVPGDQINVNATYFSRTAPLVKPTYGKFSFRTMQVFVPYYQVADDFDAFVGGNTSWLSSTPVLRYVTPNVLLQATNNFFSNSGSSSSFDYTYVDSTGTQSYRLLGSKGKFVWKVLNALGYCLPENADLQTTGTWLTGFGAKKLSAMPLLAFFKAYNDYMSQSQRFNTSTLTNFLNKVRHNVTVTGYTTTGAIGTAGLTTLFNSLLLSYENDYFVSAWEEANSPIEDMPGVFQVSVPSTPISNPLTAQRGNQDTVLTDISAVTQLGQRALDVLRDFDLWVKRRNYAGSREVQQIYATFGIKPEDYRANYAHVIGTSVKPVQVGDVTSTASSNFTQSGSTKTTLLGDYSGKAILNDGDSFSYKADEYGMLFVLGWYTVNPMNVYGFDRNVLRSEPFDWYTPQFDGLGAQAISYAELYESPVIVASDDSSSSDNVFGFTERYNEYRFGKDKITGDFRSYFDGSDMNTWHTGRLMNYLRRTNNMVAQSNSVNTLPQYGSEFNRIFSITDSSVDHFYMTAQFNVTAMRPMLSYNQVTGLGEGDTVVPRNGNTIN